MKFTNEQAANIVLTAENNTIYQPESDAQIRALTVHNPTDTNISITLSVGEQQYIKKTVTAGATEVLSQLFNQQIKKAEPLNMSGEGAHVLLTVVEITE